MVLDDGDLRRAPDGQLRFSQPGYDPDAIAEIEEWFSRDYSIQFANFPVSDDDIQGATS